MRLILDSVADQSRLQPRGRRRKHERDRCKRDRARPELVVLNPRAAYQPRTALRRLRKAGTVHLRYGSLTIPLRRNSWNLVWDAALIGI